MRPKKSEGLGWGYLVAGAFFLFDPFVAVFDFLPDVIGYLLILRGLRSLSLLEGHFDSAIRCFRRLAILSGVRILSIFVIFGLMPATERPVGYLLFTFTLGVLDCLVLFPAWQELAGGMTQAAYLHSGTAALETGRHGSSRTDRILRMTLFFMTLREVMAVLPEATVLFNSQSGEIEWSRWNFLYDYVGILRLFSIVITLVFGVVWLVKFLRYLRSLHRDVAFQESMRGALGRYMDLHPDYVRCRAVKRALFLLGVAGVLLLDVFVDGVGVLPDALAAVCMMVAVAELWRSARIRGRYALAASGCYLVLCMAAGVAQSIFLHGLCEGNLMDADSYVATRQSYMLENAHAMLKDPDVRADYYVVCGLVILAQVCLVLLLLCLRRVLNCAIDRYTGLPRGRENDPRLIGGDEDIHRELRRSLLRATVIGCVAAVFPVLYILTLPYALNSPLQFCGYLTLVADIVFAVSLIRVLGNIRQQMETRYLLD